MRQATTIALSVAAVAVLAVSATGLFLMSQEKPATLRMATTTSTWDSGLLSNILPVFENKSNCRVQVIAVGSGQAMELGKNGDVDILMVHSPSSEIQFVKDGYGTNRTQLMYNWFVIVGANSDPAGTRYAANATDAFKKIYDNGTVGNAVFVSRSDSSGTYTKELSIWAKLGFNKTDVASFDSSWYKQSGKGMGDVLDMCEQMDAYTLSDDATYYSRVDQDLIPHISITLSGDSSLKNQYSVILVNASRWSHINSTMARAFLTWVTSQDGQDLIKSYVRYGHQLFVPNAPGYSSTLSLQRVQTSAALTEMIATGRGTVFVQELEMLRCAS